MKVLQTDQAPAAIGPYSQAIMTDSLIFLSGQIGIAPKPAPWRRGSRNRASRPLRISAKFCVRPDWITAAS